MVKTIFRAGAAIFVGAMAVTLASAGLGTQNSASKLPFNYKPFSADMAMTGRMGSQQGKVYMGENAYRTEMTGRQGMAMATIMRFDKNVVWMLMPGNRYMEMAMGERAGMMGALHDKTSKIDTQDLGADKVGEYDCEKYRVHTVTANYETTGLVWIGKSGDAKDFLVKTEDEKSGISVEYSNIKPGEPDASLFEVPAGYQKIQMPNMPGMPGMPHP
ncbi:MAG TPA: DUF4412 domain-containing protein [Candidatus Acidoferrales bacterium]|nr:DUF4412 domain-containing protein [Candidatus Acidoferrales bacterium]